jgi:hypothetical protein
MYTIQKTDYGLYVTMGGRYNPEEIEHYIAEKERLIGEFDSPFSMLVDLRAAYPTAPQDQQLLEESQGRMRTGNLLRMAIVTLSPVVRNQVQQISFTSHLGDRTRVINASKHDNWEELAMNWILQGVEPPIDEKTNRFIARV